MKNQKTVFNPYPQNTHLLLWQRESDLPGALSTKKKGISLLGQTISWELISFRSYFIDRYLISRKTTHKESCIPQIM
jgi:hypothetical protein